MKHSLFPKQERLHSKLRISKLFSEGRSLSNKQSPLKVIYLTYDTADKNNASVLISVPKKRIKKASRRNAIKRRVKEIYRLNKSILYPVLDRSSIDIAFIYSSDKEFNYSIIEEKVILSLKEIVKKCSDTL